MGNDDERALVAAAQSWRPCCTSTPCFVEHYDRIYAICRRIAGNDADAADATQEALMAIVRGLPRFDGRAGILDMVISGRNKRLPRRATTSQSADPHPRWSTNTRAGWTNKSITTEPAFDEQIAERDRNLPPPLRQLPEDFREYPSLLRDCGGLDYAEIAETLGIPPGTVRSRIARGRKKLAESLTAGNQPPDGQRQNLQP